MTIRMYANRKQLNLDNVEVTLSQSRIHADDCGECESSEGFVERIDKIIKLEGDLSDEEKQQRLKIANKCPLYKTLHNEILIDSKLV